MPNSRLQLRILLEIQPFKLFDILVAKAKTQYKTENLKGGISKKYPRMWHAFIILTKVILGIVWAILETDTWEPLVELTRNDPDMLKLAVFFIICALILKRIPSNVPCAAGALLKVAL